METYIRKVNNLGQLAMRVKGSRSHQFTTETGMKIYFDAQGIPKNVLGDSPVTNLEAHILNNGHMNTIITLLRQILLLRSIQ